MVFGIATRIKKFLAKEPEKKMKYDMQEIIKLYRMATTDVKTNLFNFRYFETEMQREMAIAKRYKRAISMILIDIDDFKSINDRYGYKMGDEVLKKVALLIKTNIRDTDIAARFGGEEFTILMPETSSEKAKQLAERLRELIMNDPFLKSYRLTVSIGIGYQGNGSEEKMKAEGEAKFTRVESLYEEFMPKKNYAVNVDLFDQANIALRYAKKHGKNMSVLFNPTMSFSKV